MSDLIDRAEAQSAIQFVARRYTVAHEARGAGKVVWSDDLISVTDAMNVLREIPSTQKKGHWIDEETNYLCSECHRGCWVNSDYCPWCGSDMRGQPDRKIGYYKI